MFFGKLFWNSIFKHSLSPFLAYGHSSHYPKGLYDTHSLRSFVLSGSQFSVRIGRGFLPANTNEQRAKVVKAGNDGWVCKVKKSSFEERRKILKNFSAAGNRALSNIRKFSTPEDYMKWCPTAKGFARYHNCDQCGQQMIAWFGGKPRPRKRFCNRLCFSLFQQEHPHYCYPHNCHMFYSTKMRTEFCLRSKLEVWFAELLEEEPKVTSWQVPHFFVPYEYCGKQHKYFPDFLVNEKYLLELKSGFFAKKQGYEKNREKIKAAITFSNLKNWEFCYWQFNASNFTKNKLIKDVRCVAFLEALS